VVRCLLKAHGVDVDHRLKNGATALAVAAIHGHVKIIEKLTAHSRGNGLEIATGAFPVEDQFECTKKCHEAVLK
jgi:ankyrin repeat protein